MSKTTSPKQPLTLTKCGIMMPISSIDGCGADHWLEVQEILKDVITAAGFEPNLVCDAEDAGVIQSRIIYNVYHYPIIVCDVSARNPNVMFELGMRFAFDKPTILIKDDQTNFSFDTSSIEHLIYPRNLRFARILTFKEQLQKKLEATYKVSRNDHEYSPFLEHFGNYKKAQLPIRK